MMKGWKEVKLGDHASFIQGLQVPVEEQSLVCDKGFVRFIRIIDYTSNGEEPPRYIQKPSRTKCFVEKNDLVMIRYGSKTAGRVGMGFEGVIANNTFIIQLDQNSFTNKFLYYFFSLEDIYRGLNSWESSSTMPAITFGIIKKFKVPQPPLPTQRKIASILSAYDDLIENNLKRIKLIEEKAQLTYEKWFSVKGTPNGWNEYKLGELIDFHIGGGWGEEFQTDGFPDPAYVIRGTDMDNLPLGSIENVPNRWHKVSNLKSRRLKHGDIVFEVSGGSSYEGVARTLLITEGLLNQFDGDVMCASFCKLMRPKSVSYSYALILFLKYLRKTKSTEIFEKRSASNIVNYNWEAFLKFQAVKMPNDELLEGFNDIVEPMISSIYNLGNQITKLKEARDILLPRLMTGVIDVEQMKLENLQSTTA